MAVPLWKKLVFASFPLVFLLGSVELFFRLRPHERKAYATQSGFVEADPDLVWSLKRQPGGPLSTNELGLRDLPYDAAAEHTVLLLGDSVSWGDGVGDVRRVYPQLLEARLEERRGPASWEIVNASVPGYSTFQELAWLRLHGLALEPDAVVLQLCLNDVDERYLALAEYGGDNFFLGVDTRLAIRGLQGFLIRHSRAWEALNRGLQNRGRHHQELRTRELTRDEPPSDMEAAWQRMMEELDGVRRTAAEEGLPWLLLIAPFRFQAEDPAALRQPQDRLLAWARTHGVPVVDVLAELAGLSREARLAAFNDETHFSELGHALVAELALEDVARLVGEGADSGLTRAQRWAEAAAEMARNGDYEAAALLLEEAAAADSREVRVYQYTANVRYLMGDTAGARAALVHALELDPGNALLRRNLEALEEE